MKNRIARLAPNYVCCVIAARRSLDLMVLSLLENNMAKNDSASPKVTIDGKDYALDSLSESAAAQLLSLQAVDRRIENLQEELAILQTARIAYGNALKSALEA